MCECCVLHLGLNIAPLAIEIVQPACERMRLLGIGSQQAFDADAHVLQAPRCIQTRTEHEAQIVSGRPCHIASRQLE